jgi:20S proteasome subunit beta 4
VDKIATLVDPFPESRSSSISPSPWSWSSQQSAIIAAAAGDAADSDRLLGILKAYAALEEFQNGWGCDVRYVTSPKSQYTSDQQYSQQILQEAPGLDVTAMAHFARRNIAEQMRSSTPYRVCLLIAGMALVEENSHDSNHPMLPFGGSTIKSSYKSSGFASEMVQKQVQQACGTRSETKTNGDDNPLSSLHSLTLYRPRLYWLDEYGSLQRIQYGAHGFGANFLLSILDRGYRPDMTLEDATALMKECFLQLRSRYVINSPHPPCLKCISANGVQWIQWRDIGGH